MALTIMPIFYAHGETQTLTNVGFIQGNIWYSEEPFFDGDHIRIYTVLHNNSGQDITGTIVFYDNETPINSNNFSIANERVQDQWTDWQAVYGSHKISASITNAKMILPGGEEVTIVLQNSQTGVSDRFVDIDTDEDVIGNSADADDDNDGMPDTKEVSIGTNPLKQDTDEDGINDAKDTDPLIPEKPAASQTPQTTETSPEQANSILPFATHAIALIANKIETARKALLAQIERRIEHLKAEMKEQNIKKESVQPTTKKNGAEARLGTKAMLKDSGIFQYLNLYIHYALLFILKYKILFYFVLALLFYYLTRLFYRKVFRSY